MICAAYAVTVQFLAYELSGSYGICYSVGSALKRSPGSVSTLILHVSGKLHPGNEANPSVTIITA
jgi:hypothetical protein